MYCCLHYQYPYNADIVSLEKKISPIKLTSARLSQFFLVTSSPPVPHLGDERATAEQRLVDLLEVDEVFVDDSLEKEDLLIMPKEGNAPLVRMLLHFSLGDEWLNLAGSRIELPSYRAKLLVEAFSFILWASGEPEGKYVC